MNRKLITLAAAGVVLTAGTTAAVAMTADNPVRAVPINVTFTAPNGAHPVRVNAYGLTVSLRCWTPSQGGGVRAQANILRRTGWHGYGIASHDRQTAYTLLLANRDTMLGPTATNAAYLHLDLVGPKGNSFTLSLGYGGRPADVNPRVGPACRFVGSMASEGH